MRLLKTKSSYPIGLDISDLGFKFVQLEKSSDKIKVQALGKYELEAGVIAGGAISNEEAAVKAVKRMLAKPKSGSISTDEVVACLPETKTFIKLIEVEKGANPLKDVIASEIEKYVPLARKEEYFDYQVVREDSEKYDVVIGAAPRKVVDSYISLLENVGLSLVALEIEPVALVRALLSEESPQYSGSADPTYGIIDIGAVRSSFVVYAGQSILFSISIPVSGNYITNKIAESLQIDKDQAEKAKIICGLDKGKARGIVHDVLKEHMQELTGRIKEAMEFYRTHYADYPAVDQMILCGGGANIKNLDSLLKGKLDVEVTVGDSFANLDQTSDELAKHFVETHQLQDTNVAQEELSIKQDTSLNYATAVGLALRNIYTDKI